MSVIIEGLYMNDRFDCLMKLISGFKKDIEVNYLYNAKLHSVENDK